MDASHSDLDAIRKIVAELAARVYRIERKLGIEAESGEARGAESARAASPEAGVTHAPAKEAVPPPPAAGFPPRVPQRVEVPLPTQQPEADLESRIGSHWLNRIGISALLIGISYFLKFAFDNNWIGPAGRVTIGLLAGIAGGRGGEPLPP